MIQAPNKTADSHFSGQITRGEQDRRVFEMPDSLGRKSMRPRPLFLRSARLAKDSPGEGYPYDLAAVRALERLAFSQVTLLVGDNGTGKSTITEALAVGSGFNAEGGGRNLRFSTFATHSDLSDHIELVWNQRPRWGWFLRAETFYGMATHIATDDPEYGIGALFPNLHGESHGESFLDIALTRFRTAGLYILDEPESALSLHGQLKLLRIMHDSCAEGSQFIIATHSPVLMAFPEATIFHFNDDGPHQIGYDEVPAVQLWRRFLDDPPSLLRHLFSDD
jgi:predicted ATPase